MTTLAFITATFSSATSTRLSVAKAQRLYRVHPVHLSGRWCTHERGGFTLAEMMIVVLIIAALGTLVVAPLASRFRRSQETVTLVSMRNVRQVILEDYRDDMYEQLPFPTDATRLQHPQLNYLFVNPGDFASGPSTTWFYDPATMRGWAGPYLENSASYTLRPEVGFTNRYGEEGDAAPLDGWGNPIVIQQPVLDGSTASSTSLAAARLVSAGPNGVLETPPTELFPTDGQLGDDLVLYFRAN